LTQPAVPAPSSPKSLELQLGPGWRFDSRRRRFEQESGETFSPYGDLPEGARIVYKVPRLAKADPARLSGAERDLQRYVQVILPVDAPVHTYLAQVRAWPSVAEAQGGPVVSLPRLGKSS
jgi:hypothetical protein